MEAKIHRGWPAAVLAVALGVLLVLSVRGRPLDPFEDFLRSVPMLAVGEPILTLGSPHPEMDQLYRAVDFAALRGDGSVLVSDPVSRRIHRYTGAGTPIGRWGRWGSGPGEFVELRVGLDTAERVVAWDPGQRRVSTFDATGSLLGSYGTRRGERYRGEVGRIGGHCYRHVRTRDRSVTELTQCLIDGETVRARLPAGRWYAWEDGTWSVHGLDAPDPDPFERMGMRFAWPSGERLPAIEGSWSDPSGVRWVRVGEVVVFFDRWGFVRGILRESEARLVTVHRGVGAFVSEAGATIRIEFRRILEP